MNNTACNTATEEGFEIIDTRLSTSLNLNLLPNMVMVDRDPDTYFNGKTMLLEPGIS